MLFKATVCTHCNSFSKHTPCLIKTTNMSLWMARLRLLMNKPDVLWRVVAGVTVFTRLSRLRNTLRWKLQPKLLQPSPFRTTSVCIISWLVWLVQQALRPASSGISINSMLLRFQQTVLSLDTISMTVYTRQHAKSMLPLSTKLRRCEMQAVLYLSEQPLLKSVSCWARC